MPRNFENASAHCWQDCLDRAHDAVIERVHRAICSGFADAAGDQRFDAARLDLDVDHRPVGDERERFGQRRNPCAVGERKLLEPRRRELGDGFVGGTLGVSGVYDRIVMNDDNPITGRVHVQLYSVGPELDGALEGRKRVLGMALVRTPVSDAFGRVLPSTCSQVFLQVVAL